MKKTQKKQKKKRQFWGKKHLGKVKAKFSTNSILKKNIFNKDNFEKKTWRNIVPKQNPCGENTVVIYNVFF